MKREKIFLAGVLLGCVTVTGYAQSSNGTSYSTKGRRLERPHVTFELPNRRDPMLSQDDLLVIKHREQQRLLAEENERKRRAAEERRRAAEEERRRQRELALIKDPTLLIREQISIGGIIDKEVLIGGRLYSVGSTYKGAKIVGVGADSVTFSYKGRKFVKKVKI